MFVRAFLCPPGWGNHPSDRWLVGAIAVAVRHACDWRYRWASATEQP
jgi:hypothetical protein